MPSRAANYWVPRSEFEAPTRRRVRPIDVYGEREQRVDDTEWLNEAGANAWPVLTKDPTIRRRAVELAEVERCKVLIFALPQADMTGAEQAKRYMTNWNRILQACRKPGPRIYMVHANRIVLSYPSRA